MPVVKFHLSRYTGSVAPIENFNSGWWRSTVGGVLQERKIFGTFSGTRFRTRGSGNLGAWGPDASQLVSELSRRIAVVSGEPRLAAFLRQRIDVAMQRGNAPAILGTIPPELSVE